MKLTRIDNILKDCEAHLSSSSVSVTEIDNLLAKSILVIMYSEFEEEIGKIIDKKFLSIEDDAIKELLKSCVKRELRGIKTDSLSNFLNKLGSSYKNRFSQDMQDNQSVTSFYNNICTNRHKVAHSNSKECSNVTFRDVKDFYKKGHLLLDFFKQALLQADAIPVGPSQPRGPQSTSGAISRPP